LIAPVGRGAQKPAPLYSVTGERRLNTARLLSIPVEKTKNVSERGERPAAAVHAT
jgi:hypothetical protein